MKPLLLLIFAATMQLFNTSSRIIVTCSNRLSPFLQQEIMELGFTPVRIFKTGVELKGTLEDCIQLNLNLRCASQVLFSINEFSARNADDLYNTLLHLEWEDIIAADGYFSITSNVDNATINNSLFANVKVKDAIADRFRNRTGQRPNSGPELDKAVIHLYWKEELAEIFVDTSGETLSKHGYRKIPGKAPMLEARRMPGLYRTNYAFMHLVGFESEMYDVKRKRLDEIITAVDGLRIIASDISGDAINISKINAAAAGVGDLIEFAVGDFATTVIPADQLGVIYFNPEYGDRLGVEAELEITYGRIGDFMKQQCKGYTGYIFTGNLELAKKIGLKPKRRIEFYTSKIDCRLFEYELYAGTKRIDP